MSFLRSCTSDTWSKFKRKAFYIRPPDRLHEATGEAEMQRVLGPHHLVALGVGSTVGAGIMVLTGIAAHQYAGPGVVLSYTFAPIAAIITAFSYSEFAAEYPVAGGAFNYISLSFGEYIGWIAACDLILEYTLSAAAVAKGFSGYLAALCNFDPGLILVQWWIFNIDFLACAAVIILGLVLLRGIKDSANFNNIVFLLQIALILFIIIAGFTAIDPANYDPFLPFGIRGVFRGAAIIFFSYIGFDTVATAAEEAKNPSRDLPIGIIGSLGIATVLYVLMCLVITGLQSYEAIDIYAPFATAFKSVGMQWASYIVAVGAIMGLITSLTGALIGQSRIYIILGRRQLLSPSLARLNDKETPVNATLLTMCTAGVLALLFDIESLAEFVSIGTLVVFATVNVAVIFRRYWVRGEGLSPRPLLWRLGLVAAASIATSVTFIQELPLFVPVVCIGLWALATATLLPLPVRYTPVTFRCPLQPWLPSFGVLLCLHLIGSLGWVAYVRWVVWWAASTCVYWFYGVHRTQQPEQQAPGGPPSDGRLTPSQPSLELGPLDSADVAAAAAGADGSGGGKPGGGGVRTRDTRQRDAAAMRTTLLGRRAQRSDADVDANGPVLPISSAASAEPAPLLARGGGGGGGSPGGGAPWAVPLHDDSDDPWSADLGGIEQRAYGDAAFRWSGAPWDGAATAVTEDSGGGRGSGAHWAADAAAGSSMDARPGDVGGAPCGEQDSRATGALPPAGRSAGAQWGGAASVGRSADPLAAVWRSGSPAVALHDNPPGHGSAGSPQGSALAIGAPVAIVADGRSAGGDAPPPAYGVGAIAEGSAPGRQAEPVGAPAAAGLREMTEASAALPAAGAPVPSNGGLLPLGVGHGGSSAAARDGGGAHGKDVPAPPGK